MFESLWYILGYTEDIKEDEILPDQKTIRQRHLCLQKIREFKNIKHRKRNKIRFYLKPKPLTFRDVLQGNVSISI